MLIKARLFTVLYGILIILNSFEYGRISIILNNSVPIIFSQNTFDSVEYKAFNKQLQAEMSIVASKNGTKYYFLHCSGVNRIKDENKVYFRSENEAQIRGLKPASGCAK